MTSSPTILVLSLAIAAAGWQSPVAAAPPAGRAAAPITEAEAARLADATTAAWTSMDAARVKALYAPSVVGFDFSIEPLSMDRATWDKAQDAFVTAKLDSAVQKERRIQLLGPDIFVVSGRWEVRSSAVPANNSVLRCTDVYRRDASGAWPIVNEHCSAAPKPA